MCASFLLRELYELDITTSQENADAPADQQEDKNSFDFGRNIAEVGEKYVEDHIRGSHPLDTAPAKRALANRIFFLQKIAALVAKAYMPAWTQHDGPAAFEAEYAESVLRNEEPVRAVRRHPGGGNRPEHC